MSLIDTHTHFDVAVFDPDRAEQSELAYQAGVRHLVLIGFLAKYFPQMVACYEEMRSLPVSPQAHLAFGLHPFYILEQCESDVITLENFIQNYPSIALGEIGLDTFTPEMKIPKVYAKQQHFFSQQLSLAKNYQLPVLLHIRRAHADVLKILKSQQFSQGGIAHSFSGGIEEAKAFVNLGFKIGVTGQITNPNAKKLRHTIMQLVKTVGIESLVIETDCPDMTPIACHHTHGRRNVSANLPYVVDTLCELTGLKRTILVQHLWHNSCSALQVDWAYG